MSRSFFFCGAFVLVFGLTIIMAADPEGEKSKTTRKIKFRVDVSNSADVETTVKVETTSTYRENTVKKKSSKEINVPHRLTWYPGTGELPAGWGGTVNVQVYIGGSAAISQAFYHIDGRAPFSGHDPYFDMSKYQIDFAALPEGGFVWNVNPRSN